MGSREREVEIATGRRETDGRVHLSVFTSEMLALTIKGHGERAPTLLLTAHQAKQLGEALSELILQLGEAQQLKTRDVPPSVWQGTERRTTGQLNK